MPDGEVADPDRAGSAGLPELDEPRPGAQPRGCDRVVEQQQIDVVGPQAGQRRVQTRRQLLVGLVGIPDLGGDEHVVALDLRGPERFAQMRLAAVGLRGVEVPVAGLERGFDHLHTSPLVGELPESEAELRNRVAVVHLEVRYAHFFSLAGLIGATSP